MALSLFGREVNPALNYYALDSSLIEKEVILKNKPKLKDAIREIEVSSNTLMEKTPYKEDKFSLVTSMYGFESSNISKTIKEIKRILKKGGKFIAICHDTNSLILKRNRLTLKCIDHIIFKEEIFILISQLSDLIGNIVFTRDLNALSSNKKLIKVKKKLDNKIASVQAKYPDNFNATGFNTFVKRFFSDMVGTNTYERKLVIKAKRKELLEQCNRLKELESAAFNEEKENLLLLLLKEYNLLIDANEEFYRGQDFVGRLLIIKNI